MISRRILLGGIASFSVLLLSGAPVLAEAEPVYALDGVAINGYDTVAYFTSSAPVQGKAQFSYNWNGATWLFSSAENLAAFRSDPESYAPQFGGYCSYAVSRGYTAPTAPEAWTVHEGKLFLNYSIRVRQLWSRDMEGNIARGQENWPAMLAN